MNTSTTLRRSRIVSTGMFVPEHVITNEALARVMNTSDAWIQQRTGILERRFVSDSAELLKRLAASPDREALLKEVRSGGLNGAGDSTTMTADLAFAAASQALSNAGMDASQVGLIVQTSMVPDYLYPGSASVLAERLALKSIPAISLVQGCAGFVYGLAVADQFIRTGMYKSVLLVAAELQSSIYELSDRGRDMAVLFGDGAAAAILEPAAPEDPNFVISHHLHNDGTARSCLFHDLVGTNSFPAVVGARIHAEKSRAQMDGRTLFQLGSTKAGEVIHECLAANNLRIDQIDHFLVHQANARIVQMLSSAFGIPREKIPMNIHKYGNTSGASIPLLLHEGAAEDRIKRGDLCLLVGFGTGFSWGASLLRF